MEEPSRSLAQGTLTMKIIRADTGEVEKIVVPAEAVIGADPGEED
jgi:hypothetical protein